MSAFLDLFSPGREVLTDEQAMWRVQTTEDHAAFEELVARWQNPIRRLCQRMTGDETRGDDLAQEAFLRVFLHRDKYQSGRKFSTWLWQVALNLCHDELRRRQRRGEEPLVQGEDGEELETPGHDLLPDQSATRNERAELVRRALQVLPETHRAVLVLREYEGLKLREIAEVLQIPEGTVKSRMTDALGRMAHLLRPLMTETPAGAPCPPHLLPSVVL